MMSTRASALADRFTQANDQMMAAAQRCSEAAWSSKTAGEGWSVGVVVHHVAESHKRVGQLAHLVATGASFPPVTMDMIHQGNAQHAQQHASCGKAETVEILRQNAGEAVAIVRRLSNEQLDRAATVLEGMPPMSTEQLIERILIGHVTSHLASVQATTATA